MLLPGNLPKPLRHNLGQILYSELDKQNQGHNRCSSALHYYTGSLSSLLKELHLELV